MPGTLGDLLTAIFVTVHAENPHRMNRQAARVVAVRDRSESGEAARRRDGLCVCSFTDYCRIKVSVLPHDQWQEDQQTQSRCLARKLRSPEESGPRLQTIDFSPFVKRKS